MKKWYHHSGARPPPPTPRGLENVTTEQEELYTRLYLEGDHITLLVQPVAIPDDPSSEE